MKRVTLAAAVVALSFVGFADVVETPLGGAVGLFKDFAHHARIVFDGYTGSSALTNFPALVRIREGDGGFYASDCQRPAGRDVRFSVADGAEIVSEVISFNQDGVSEFWVRVPVLAGTETCVFVHWGALSSVPEREPALKVWDDGFCAVWEMEDEGRFVTDSSVYGIHGSVNGDGMTAVGVVGKCRTFSSAKSQYAKIGGCGGENAGLASRTATWECWVKMDSKPTANMALLSHAAGAWGDGRYFAFDSSGKFLVNRTGQLSSSAWTAGDWHHFAWTEQNKSLCLYVDGTRVSSASATSPISGNQDMPMLIGYSDSGWIKGYLNGQVDEVRISSVCRNADYVKATYTNVAFNADFIAFEPTGATLTVCGNEILPPEAGIVPAYGTSAAGGTLTASVPASFEKDGVRWTCLGYKIVADGKLVKSGEGTEVDEAWPDAALDVAVSWTWKKQYLVKVQAGENGSVTPATEVWCDPQSVVAVAATAADDHHAFYRWTGNCPKTETFTASFSMAVDGPIELTASFGKRRDVATLADLSQAISDADDGDVVLVADGTYAMSEVTANPRFTIEKPIAVRAANGPGKVVFDLGKAWGVGAFKLNSSGAVLDGLVVSNGNATGWYFWGCGALVTSGNLKNCVFDTFSLSTQGEGIVQVTSGWLSGCLFRNCKGSGAGYDSYALRVAGNGVLVDSCRFLGNTSGYKGVLSLQGGVVRNSLIVGNNCVGGTLGGAVGATGGRLENCTIAFNTNAVANAFGGGVYGGSEMYVPVVNCAFADNYVVNAANGPDFYRAALRNSVAQGAVDGQDGNVAAAAQFRDWAAGDFSPTGVSPVKDAGLYLKWAFDPTAKDISGESRLNGVTVDAGANEYVSSGDEPLSVNVLASADLGTDELEVSFTAVVGGATSAVSFVWDFGDGTRSEDEAPVHKYAKPGYFNVTLVVTEEGTERTETFSKSDMIKVLPSVCYVRAKLPNDSVPWTPTEPYCTYETAAANVRDALLVGPSRIELGEGTIPIAASGAPTSYDSVGKIHYVGQGPHKTTVDCTGGFMLHFSGQGTVLDSLTFYNAGNLYYESAVQLNEGVTITNCHVHGCGSRAHGGGLGLKGATAVDCDVSGNNQSWNTCGILLAGGATAERCVITNNFKNGGIWFGTGGGRLRNCLIANNTNENGGYDSGSGGGVFAWAGTGVLENCTVVSNSAALNAGSAYVNAGYGLVMTNCIVWGGRCLADKDVPSAEICVADGLDSAKCSFASCCAPDLVGLAGENIGADPKLNLGQKPRLPYWGVLGSSPCKNAGKKADWMEGAVDLNGDLRLFGGKPDMGCYESQIGGMMLIVR